MVTRDAKNPWHDRFARPRIEDLARLYEDPEVAVLEFLRDAVGERTGAAPAIEWRGIAWKWTLVYTRPSEAEAWAYIIPTAGSPTVAVPVPANPLSPADLKRTPRFIRDAIPLAPRVGQVLWLELAIESMANAEGLLAFIDLATEPQLA
ncbi:MAG: hypothetical protein AAFY46_11280 [Planctomycetota bacterium]